MDNLAWVDKGPAVVEDIPAVAGSRAVEADSLAAVEDSLAAVEGNIPAVADNRAVEVDSLVAVEGNIPAAGDNRAVEADSLAAAVDNIPAAGDNRAAGVPTVSCHNGGKRVRRGLRVCRSWGRSKEAGCRRHYRTADPEHYSHRTWHILSIAAYYFLHYIPETFIKLTHLSLNKFNRFLDYIHRYKINQYTEKY